jgi:hypothetical protein
MNQQAIARPSLAIDLVHQPFPLTGIVRHGVHRTPGISCESFVSFIPLLGGAHPPECRPAPYRSETRRLPNEDDRSPTFSSHTTGGLWQYAPAWTPMYCS